MLKMLLTEIRKLVADPGAGNAAARRLAPRAYLDPTEEEAEAQWRELVHDDLVGARVRAFDTIWTLLDEAVPVRGRVELTLDAAHEDLFLRSVNDLRLSLAALLEESGRAPDGDADGTARVAGAAAPREQPPGDDDQARMLLEWLGGLVADHVDLLLAEMPEEPGADSGIS
jgi:hypothetical protein